MLTTTPDRVVWTNDQGLIWTTGYDLVSPMFSWSADPELGRGRQDIVEGNPAGLFPLTAGEQVAFQVTGSSEKQPGGWKMEQRCEVSGQAQVTVEAGTFNTFQIGCQRGDTLETLFYSPVVQNYVLRTRQFPFRSERKELAGFQHAELREARDEPLVAMTDGDSRQASLGRSTEMPVDPSAARTLPPAPPVPPAGAMMPAGAPTGDMAAMVQRMEAVLAHSIGEQRFNMSLMTVFAVLALVLAAIGVYSVLAYLVARRTREIGIQVALGAGRRDVIGMVLRQGMLPVAIGLGLGLVGAVFLARFLGGMLFEVAAFSVPVFLLVALVLTAVAALACLLPALRASRVAPMLALRAE